MELSIKERLKETIYDYYWMAYYPNADEKEFKENWLTKNDNQAFIDGLVIKVIEIIEELLKKQREICADIYDADIFLYSNLSAQSSEKIPQVIKANILSAPSPLGEKK